MISAIFRSASERRVPLMLFLFLAACLTLTAATSSAQIQPPTGPVTVCVAQPAPAADSHQFAVDGGAYAPVARDATTDARCPVSSAFSFTIPGASFTVGQHTITLRASNQFGTTQGPAYAVEVGIAPGIPVVVGVLPPVGQ